MSFILIQMLVSRMNGGNLLPFALRAFEHPGDGVEMLEAYSEVVAHVGKGDALAFESVQDQAGVAAAVVPQSEAEERHGHRSPTRTLISLPVLREILLTLLLVKLVCRAVKDQEPTEDYFSAHGEPLGEDLNRVVVPLLGTRSADHSGMIEESVSGHEDRSCDPVAEHFDLLVRVLRPASDS